MKRISDQQNELLIRVDEVLHYLWDPIGVSGVPPARDEYDAYTKPVFSMLIRDCNETEIAKYLRDIRVINMGLGEPEHSLPEQDIAEILFAWKESILGEEK